jgi:tetratricopeptide (TPR) repeat protein
MTTVSSLHTELPYERSAYNEQISQNIQTALPQFNRIIKPYVTFNILFAFLGIAEFVLIAFFFTFLVHTSILAFSFALIFLTFFSYLIIRLYFQTKKPEQFIELTQRYVQACYKLISYREGIPEHHIAVAEACFKFAEALHGREYTHYQLPIRTPALQTLLEKWSCWTLWHDHHKMKEMLLQHSIEEHIKMVRSEPTNLEVHAALANAYVMLSGLYVAPQKNNPQTEDRWIPPQQFSDILKQKFRITAEKAIEEFKILSAYAPNDPWVHAQLAYSYHDLQMPKEELREYEIIIQLRPDDQDTLFKLGVLYFQQGLNANGLRIYEKLRQSNQKRAETLMSYYGIQTSS